MFHSRLDARTILSGAALLVAICTSLPLHADEPKANKYALLVGIKDYQHQKLPALKYTENDVTEMATVLRAANYEVVLLTSTDGKKDAKAKPTRANIDKQLKALLAKCKKNDTVLVALAGHGLQFDQVQDSFFCPEDAVPLSDEKSLKTLVSIKVVYQQLGNSPGAVKLLLVDACRNDPSGGRGVEDAKGAGQPPKGVAALFSCSGGERAYEVDNYRHGIFFYHVLEGLRGKAKNSEDNVTWDGLEAYVRQRVSEDAPKLLDGVQQTPSLNAGEARGQPPVLIGRDTKLATRSRLSFRMAALDRATAERLRLPQRCQAQVWFVTPGSTADLMGLRRGDVIERINGRDVETVALATTAMHDLALGERVELEIRRERDKLKLAGRHETSLTEEEEFRRVRELALKNDPAAQHCLAIFYENGSGVAKDEAEAAKWFRKAADLGFVRSQAELGFLYANGRGVTKDEAEAVKWYRKAADQGNGDAQNRLGFHYAQGRGVTKDEVEAVKWFRKAADQGHNAAQYHVGVHYEHGHGVKKNATEAVVWYRKAAAQGNKDAVKALERLKEAL